MGLDAAIEVTDRTARIRLAGELDSTTAPVVWSLINRAAQSELDQLVLEVADLTYMSSAGLRCLVFAHAVAPDAEIVLMDARPDVAEVVKLVGLDRAVTLVESGKAR